MNAKSSGMIPLRKARMAGGAWVDATLHRDCTADLLPELEQVWQEARLAVANSHSHALEHGHWDWRNKALAVEAGISRLIAIECEGDYQGVMAVLSGLRPSRLVSGLVVYVEYVETAPWNLKGLSVPPRFEGVGSALLAEAVRISMEGESAGAIGLHSLAQAERFYERCGMTRLGPDPDYYELPYYEFTQASAGQFLSTIKGEP